jgi:hypothetical protein
LRAEFPPFAVLQHRFRGLEGLAGTGEEGVPCRNVLTDRPFKFPILAAATLLGVSRETLEKAITAVPPDKHRAAVNIGTPKRAVWRWHGRDDVLAWWRAYGDWLARLKAPHKAARVPQRASISTGVNGPLRLSEIKGGRG